MRSLRAWPLIWVSLMAACSKSGAPAGGGAMAVVPTQAQHLDRSCDTAAYPSAAWAACEAENYGKSQKPAVEALDARFQARLIAQSALNLRAWLARAQADPSWLDPRAGNTAATPVCTTLELPCLGDPFRYPEAGGPDGETFYEQQAEVIPVVFYDRDCARLSGRVWRPRSAGSASLPGIVITNGSFQAPEPWYWWAAQELVRAGYVVLSYDPRGQGRSDQQTPTLLQGTNLNPKVFWEGQVDAIDFFRSSPVRPYPHDVSCAGTYPTLTAPHNPLWSRIDPARLGIAGHSLGAIGVSVVQGYGAPGAAAWPGKMDDHNPVKVAVAWDSLIRSDGAGFAPANDYPVPEPLLGALFTIGTTGALPKFAPRVPSLSFNADYGLAPVPHTLPPDAESHKLAFAEWQAAGVPAYVLGFQGSTHLDYSLSAALPATSWCPDLSSGACRGGWAQPAIRHYTLAWFDRWLKQPGEPGYADADQRLVDDGGEHGALKLSYRYRSARDYPDRSGKRQHCEDIRSGCP